MIYFYRWFKEQTIQGWIYYEYFFLWIWFICNWAHVFLMIDITLTNDRYKRGLSALRRNATNKPNNCLFGNIVCLKIYFVTNNFVSYNKPLPTNNLRVSYLKRFKSLPPWVTGEWKKLRITFSNWMKLKISIFVTWWVPKLKNTFLMEKNIQEKSIIYRCYSNSVSS